MEDKFQKIVFSEQEIAEILQNIAEQRVGKPGVFVNFEIVPETHYYLGKDYPVWTLKQAKVVLKK